MVYVKADRIKEVSATNGPSTFQLAGSVFKFRSFATVMLDADTTDILIEHATLNEWEICSSTIDIIPGTGVYLSRGTIKSSSNNGSRVTFSNGVKFVSMIPPADSYLRTDSNGDIALPRDVTIGRDLTITGTLAATTIKSTATTPLVLYRAAAAANVSAEFRNDTASWFAGQGADGTFALDTDAAISTSPKFSVATTGDTTVGRDLSVTRNATVTGLASLGSLGVTGNAAIGGTLSVVGATTFVSALLMSNQKITSLGDPTSAQDAATKFYVDAVIQGLDPKPTARVATAAALPTCTYNNAAGTLTASANGVLTIDGIAVVVGDGVLVKNQASAFQNGLYAVTTAGAVGAAFVLTRHASMNAATEVVGAFIPVGSEGTANPNSLWLCNPSGTVTMGTTALPFTQLNRGTDLASGTGISISGNTVSISPTTGTGNVVFGANPTLTGTITAAAANFSGAVAFSSTLNAATATLSSTLTGVAANFSGAVTSTSTSAAFVANTAAGNVRSVMFQSAGSARFEVGVSATAEAGSNVGSDFFINRHNDVGTYVSTPLQITRSTGLTTIGSGLNVVGTVGIGDTGTRLLVTSTGGGAVFNQNDNSAIIFQNQGTELARLQPSGFLGLGVTPTSILHVKGAGEAAAVVTTSANLGATLTLQDTGVAVNNGGVVQFASGQGSFAAIKGLVRNGSSNVAGYLSFQTRAAVTDATLTERLLLTDTGAVVTGTLAVSGAATVLNATAIPAGGTAGSGFKFFSTSNFGVFGGSGAPTLAAARGSLYLSSSGNAYVNTDGSTTWSPFTTAAGSGTVTNGLAGQLATYTSNGNVLDGTTTITGITLSNCIANTQTAGDNSTKVATTQFVTSALSAAIPTGTLLPNTGFSAPGGFLMCDGTAVSRTTYAALFAWLTRTSTVTMTVASPGVVTWTAHPLVVGDKVSFETTGALPTGLAVGTNYYVVSIATNTFQVSATPGGAAINTTGTQSGTHTCRHNPWGCGNGTTTFNVPDLRGRTLVGADPTDAATRMGNQLVTKAVLGAVGGAGTHTLSAAEMPSHAHGVNDGTHAHGVSDPWHGHGASGLGYVGNNLANGTDRAVGTGDGTNSGAYQSVAVTVNAAPTGIGIFASGANISIQAAGSGGTHNNVQPSAACHIIIKV